MSDSIDLAVVGAGPCGIAVGAAAATAGLRTILYDRGCVTNSLVNYPYYLTFFSTARKLEIAGVPFTIADSKPSRREALSYYRRVVQHYDLDVRQYEEVTSIEGHRGDFLLQTRAKSGGEGTVRAKAVVVATGGFHEPNYLHVPGEELPKVKHYYKEPYPFYDQDVLVVGAGNSAVESALETYRAGARVTMVHIFDEIDRGVKPWVVPDITKPVGERRDRGLLAPSGPGDPSHQRRTPEHGLGADGGDPERLGARHDGLAAGPRIHLGTRYQHR